MKENFYRSLGLLIFMWFALLAQSCCAQVSADDEEWKRGYHGFNLICKGLGLEHQSFADWQRTNASEKVLIVLGEPSKYQDVSAFLRQGGRVLYATDQDSARLRRYGLNFASKKDWTVQDSSEGFKGHLDCPKISSLDLGHPVLAGVDYLVANRPGIIEGWGRGLKTLATLPQMKKTGGRYLFMTSAETSNGGKLLCVADQSLFTNQMLLHGENAMFSKQAVEWLMTDDRKFVHVVSNGVDEFPMNLANLDVEIPPPTREEVVEALQELPPSMLLEFGNEVATILEEEDMFNEFLNSLTEKIRPKAMNRFLIFLAFATACVFAMVVFAGQRKFGQQSASGVAQANVRLKNKSDKRQEIVERQMAVEALLDSFCLESSNRRYRTWTNFPTDLDVGASEKRSSGVEAMLKSMEKMNVLYKSKPSKYWTRKRLLELEHEINHWRAFFGIKPTVDVVLDPADSKIIT